MEELYRQIPKMDKLLERKDAILLTQQYGQPYTVECLRKAVEKIKSSIKSNTKNTIDNLVEDMVSSSLEEARLVPMQSVINGTGVILHTNLGRAPYGTSFISEALKILSGGANVEMELVEGKRGVRGEYVRQAIARLCQAEDAIIVNNNAAAVLLTLSALAQNREVIISRGELIQIGGGFRIPDVINQGGAILREVGTTNITTLEDYRKAIRPETGALVKVHLSNFYQGGFEKRPSTKELASLKTASLPFIEDLGSGNLISHLDSIKLPDNTPAQVLKDGADLVTFSGDKLLGGPQAGIIAGRADMIKHLAKNPLMRAIRPDKFVYTMLQIVLSAYEKGELDKISPWKQIRQSRDDIKKRIDKFLHTYLPVSDLTNLKIIDTFGEFGGGSLPGETIESAAIVITKRQPQKAAEFFRKNIPSVIGIIKDDAFMIDFLAIDSEEEQQLSHTIKAYFSGNQHE